MRLSGKVVLVTGATGLIGANVVEQLRRRGDDVRVLVREGSDSSALQELGCQVVTGDIRREADVAQAADGVSAIINSAALLGGPGLDLAEMLAANHFGSRWCYDAARAAGIKVVELTTTPFLRQDITLTEQPEVLDESRYQHDAYAISKGRAFVEGRDRAAAGEDICFVIPGATFGPSPVVERAMASTSFNRVLRGAIRGRISSYPAYPLPWSPASDVAQVVVAALDKGERGVTYIAFGAGPAMTTAEFLNLGCAVAGARHRVADVVISADDEQARATFGQTIVDMATRKKPEPLYDDAVTRTAFGLSVTPVPDAVASTVDWLVENSLLP